MCPPQRPTGTLVAVGGPPGPHSRRVLEAQS